MFYKEAWLVEAYLQTHLKNTAQVWAQGQPIKNAPGFVGTNNPPSIHKSKAHKTISKGKAHQKTPESEDVLLPPTASSSCRQLTPLSNGEDTDHSARATHCHLKRMNVNVIHVLLLLLILPNHAADLCRLSYID
jgi:hypothetical protein